MDPPDQSITGLSGPDGQGVRHCSKCGWPFPNPHPSARHRRAHRRICGTVEGYKLIDPGTHSTASADDHLSDEDPKPPGIKNLERYYSCGIEVSNRSEDDSFSDAVMEFGDSGFSSKSEMPLQNNRMTSSNVEKLAEENFLPADLNVIQQPTDPTDGSEMLSQALENGSSARLPRDGVLSSKSNSLERLNFDIKSESPMVGPTNDGEVSERGSISLQAQDGHHVVRCSATQVAVDRDSKGNKESSGTLQGITLPGDAVPISYPSLMGSLASNIRAEDSETKVKAEQKSTAKGKAEETTLPNTALPASNAANESTSLDHNLLKLADQMTVTKAMAKQNADQFSEAGSLGKPADSDINLDSGEVEADVPADMEDKESQLMADDSSFKRETDVSELNLMGSKKDAAETSMVAMSSVIGSEERHQVCSDEGEGSLVSPNNSTKDHVHTSGTVGNDGDKLIRDDDDAADETIIMENYPQGESKECEADGMTLMKSTADPESASSSAKYFCVNDGSIKKTEPQYAATDICNNLTKTGSNVEDQEHKEEINGVRSDGGMDSNNEIQLECATAADQSEKVGLCEKPAESSVKDPLAVRVSTSEHTGDPRSRGENLEGCSVSAKAPVDAKVAPPSEDSRTPLDEASPASKGHHHFSSDAFEPPSFMTLVEPNAGVGRTTAESASRAAWFPSAAHVVTESEGRKKNEEIITQVAGKQRTPLKSLLGEAKSETNNSLKSPLLSSPVRKDDGLATAQSPPDTRKEWKSPVRYPTAIKREKGRVKGRPYWAQFVCCSSSVN